MDLGSVLGNDWGIVVLGTVAGGVWSLLKTTEAYGTLCRNRFRRALRIVAAAVEEVYRTYVRGIKAGRADGRLTEGEKERAREMARKRAIELAREEGLDLLGSVGEGFLDLWVARMVKKAKAS